MPCLGLIARKMIRPFKLIPFRTIVTAAITGQGNDCIETIPCSHQIIESLLPSTHDNAQVVCKSITVSEIKSNLGGSSHPDPSWNLKCMTMSDWIKVQVEDQVTEDIIQWYKARGLHKDKDSDSPEIRNSLNREVSYS